MAWPRCHLTDCYLCMPSTVRLTIKSKHTIQYLNIPSALISMPYYESLPIPVPPKSYSRARNWTQPEPSNDTFTDDEKCSTDSAHRESHLVIRIKWSLRDLELPKGLSFVNAVVKTAAEIARSYCNAVQPIISNGIGFVHSST